MAEYRKLYLYANSANVAEARLILSDRSINYKEIDSIQDGVKEFQFNANQNQIDSIISEINNGVAKVYLSDSKLAISGSIGTITADFTDTYIKVASTDNTGANSTFIKTDSNGKVYTAAPGVIISGSVTAGVAAAAIGASTASNKITVKVADTATNGILIGNATSQDMPLGVGDSIDIPIDDISKVYVIRDGAADAAVKYFGS
ncbi:MAG: hypothetical protein KC589_08945 [Nanoarchaeota archaeon]|nr:hypothetical protein [Nanoarchaeota archaeon]MCA9497047.1 hypothetical protein [Nanoarchaeota archaeon]